MLLVQRKSKGHRKEDQLRSELRFLLESRIYTERKMKSLAVFALLFSIGLFVPQRAGLQAQDLVYQCPMDSDIRSKTEGFAPAAG